MTRHLLGPILIGLGCGSLTGCGAGTPTHIVTGTIVLKGQPLAAGVIRFTPRDHAAPLPIVVPITAGRYTATGLRPGTYVVSIEATAPPGATDDLPTSDPGATLPLPVPAIPVKYRTGVTVEITADHPALDFDLSR